MRGTLKTSTLESKFPLLRVENNCIVSKFAGIRGASSIVGPSGGCYAFVSLEP